MSDQRFLIMMQVVECYKVPYTDTWHVKAEGSRSTLIYTTPGPMRLGTHLFVTAEEA